MKKIFTLLTGLLMTAAVFAADRRPSVTLQGGKNYEVVIDGRTISQNQFGMYGINSANGIIQINNLRMGRHTVTVFEIPRRFFASRNKRVISTATFMLQGNDVAIKIDAAGQVKVKEQRMGGYNNRDWNDHNNGFDKGYGYSQGQSKDAGWDDQDDHKFGQGQGGSQGHGGSRF